MKTLPTLNNIQDIHITTPTIGDVIQWDGTKWINAETQAPTTTLDGLSDVTITNPTTGQSLTYNGTAWVNGAATEPNRIFQGDSELVISDDGTNPSTLVLNFDNTQIMAANNQQAVFTTTNDIWISYAF